MQLIRSTFCYGTRDVAIGSARRTALLQCVACRHICQMSIVLVSAHPICRQIGHERYLSADCARTIFVADCARTIFVGRLGSNDICRQIGLEYGGRQLPIIKISKSGKKLH